MERYAVGSLLLIIAVVNTPVALVGLALVEGQRMWIQRRLRPALVPLAVTAALVMLEFWVRRGSPLHSGYEGEAGLTTVLPYSGKPGFSYPLLLGVLSILLSFGKGLLFFAPGLALVWVRAAAPLPPRLYVFRRYALLFVMGLILAYAKWWSWYGGWFWGPRFFLFASVPAALMIAHHLCHPSESLGGKTLALGVLLVSCWVGASGAVFAQRDLDVCAENAYRLEFMCWYVPEFSVLVRPFLVNPALTLRETTALAYFGLVAAVLAWPLVRASLLQLRCSCPSLSVPRP
jgi:hypothetical protein